MEILNIITNFYHDFTSQPCHIIEYLLYR